MNLGNIAILIPARNPGAFFTACLNSLRQQTYTNFVVVIVDGSSDGSWDYATNISQIDRRFLVYRQSGNGIADARNQCLREGLKLRPELLTFVDSDDYVRPDYLEKMIGALKQHNCDIVASSFYEQKGDCIWPNRVSSKLYLKLLSGYSATKALLEDVELMSHLHGKIYKSFLWDKVSFDNSINYCEDRGVLFIPFSKSKSVFVTDYMGYYYREDNANALCQESWHNKKILSTYRAYMMPLFHSFDGYDDMSKSCLCKAAMQGLFRLHLSLYPRFDYNHATKEELELMRFIMATIKRQRIRQFFVPSNKKERVKLFVYCISRVLYRFLFRLRLKQLPQN